MPDFLRSLCVVAFIAAATALADRDTCNSFPNCADCVASPYCGWCSSAVDYENGDPGFQCATVGNNSRPFKCYGVFSTERCERGYACDQGNYTCVRTAPGTGLPQAACEANCSTIGKTFECDNQTSTCIPAGPGRGSSFQLCEASCSNTHAPSSHRPVSPRPASPSPKGNHTPAPTPSAAPVYACNASTMKCALAPAGQGASLPVCEAGCKPANVTPPALQGLWRAFPISNGEAVHETDFDFTGTNDVTIATRLSSVVASVISVVSQVWFEVDGAPTMKCVYEQSNGLPETYEVMMACGTHAAPTTVSSAMGDPSYTVYFLSRCVPDGYCEFALHNGTSRSPSRWFAAALALAEPIDPCTAFGANCTYCLSQPTCGWCSAVVTYKDGQEGSQCAGVEKNGQKQQWQCSGSYSTEQCLPGWACNAVNQTCVKTVPGTGVPESTCTAQCHAKKGPPSALIGHWRGIFIQNGYLFGAQEVTITNTTVTITDTAAKTAVSAVIEHVAGQLFLTFTSGADAGKSIAGIYTITQNEIVTYVDVAFGGINEDAPSDYKSAMRPPSQQLVLAKCGSPQCTW